MPELTCHLHPDLTDHLKQIFQPFAEKHDFNGKINIRSDADLSPGDFELSWSDGGISRNSQTITRAIEAAMARHYLEEATPCSNGGGGRHYNPSGAGGEKLYERDIYRRDMCGRDMCGRGLTMSDETIEEERVNLPDFSDDGNSNSSHAKTTKSDGPKHATDLETVFDIPVKISAVLGRTTLEIADLLKLDDGDIIELDRKVGEAIDIFVNDRLIARGEVVLVDEKLGITMTEIITPNKDHA